MDGWMDGLMNGIKTWIKELLSAVQKLTLKCVGHHLNVNLKRFEEDLYNQK
jgi:hypothetical protein